MAYIQMHARSTRNMSNTGIWYTYNYHTNNSPVLAYGIVNNCIKVYLTMKWQGYILHTVKHVTLISLVQNCPERASFHTHLTTRHKKLTDCDIKTALLTILDCCNVSNCPRMFISSKYESNTPPPSPVSINGASGAENPQELILFLTNYESEILSV